MNENKIPAPAKIKITSFLLILTSIFAFIFSFIVFSFSGFSPGLQFIEILYIFLPLIGGILGILSSIYLWEGKKWSRILSIILSTIWTIFLLILIINGTSEELSLIMMLFSLMTLFLIINTLIDKKCKDFFESKNKINFLSKSL